MDNRRRGWPALRAAGESTAERLARTLRGWRRGLSPGLAARLLLALLGPGLLLLVWARLPLRSHLIATLLADSLDQLRALVVVELLGVFLAAAAIALIGPGLLVWAASGLWYGLGFVVVLPFHLGPQKLPFEYVDHAALVRSLVALAGLGLATAGLGVGVGRGGRMLAQLLWTLHREAPRRLLTGGVIAACLSLLSAYGLVQAPRILLDGPWQGVLRDLPVSHGGSAAQQLNFRYYSDAFARWRTAIVLLPPGYTGSARRYPVIYLLHGSPGGRDDWPEIGAEQILQHAVARGIPEAIIVSPDGVGPRGGSDDSWANGWVPGDDMENDLVDSLIPAVQSHFRTLDQARYRAVGGLSTGGYGAANLTLRHPHLFGLALVFSGDPLVPPPSTFGHNLLLQQANNPLLLAREPAPRSAPAFYVGWGAQDPGAAQNRELAGLLRRSGYDVRSEAVAGGHSWTVWAELLYRSLLAMGGRLRAPAHTSSFTSARGVPSWVADSLRR